MNFRAFNNYMNAITNAIDSQNNHLEKNAEITFSNNGKWALRSLERLFKDKDQNIRRWLKGKPCVFTSDKTGEKMEIDIGADVEALYYFLVFCKKITEEKEISNEFREFLALIITRSCVADEDWEEC